MVTLLTLKRNKNQKQLSEKALAVSNCNGSLHPHPRVAAVAKKTATLALFRNY